MKKLNYEDVKKAFSDNNCTLLATEYINYRTPLAYRCECGNESKISLNHFKKGNRCGCNQGTKTTLEQAQKIFSDESCVLLATEYKDARTKMPYVCLCGKESSITLNHFVNRGQRCGCGKKIYNKTNREKQAVEMIGKIINSHQITSYSHTDEKMIIFWNCQCINCGKKKLKNLSRLKQCKGCRHCELLPQGQTGFLKLLSGYKYNAKARNRNFDLTTEEFKQLTLENCHYCNATPSNIYRSGIPKRRKSTWGYYTYNGVDRKDNNLGYTLSNCVTCCEICNRGKRSVCYDDFLEHINGIRNGYENCFLQKEEVKKHKYNSSKLPQGEGGLKTIILHYKRNCKKLNREFNLNKEEVRQITSSPCFYCGKPPCQKIAIGWGQYTYNGIDRKDNNIGYHKDNCVACCKICNNSKHSMPFDDFMEYINRIKNQ